VDRLLDLASYGLFLVGRRQFLVPDRLVPFCRLWALLVPFQEWFVKGFLLVTQLV
jgi:hypothetical protein